MIFIDTIVSQSFKPSPTGERLFLPGGPWVRPYIIPDAATEQRLFNKQRWIICLLLGVIILVQPFLLQLLPELTSQPLEFLGYLAAFILVFWLAGFFTFRTDLRPL